MKIIWVAACLAAIGCGGSKHFGNGVDCGGTSCENGTVCCLDVSQSAPVYTCAKSCPTTTLTVSCDGPEDCDPNGAAYCCAQFVYQPAPNTSPNCLESGKIACAHLCDNVSPASANCAGSATLRLCGVSADCAGDSGYLNCCGGYCVSDADRDSYLNSGGSCT